MKHLLFPVLALAICVISLSLKPMVEKKIHEGREVMRQLKPSQAGFEAKSLSLYNMGFKNLIADLLWIQLLQKAKHTEMEEGNVSWEFAQLDAVTALDPKFEQAYGFGAAFLSVLRRDRLGAKLILEKWVKRKPNYWRANYLLGYHLYYEMDQFEPAAKYVLRAASLPRAPSWLSSLGVRLLSESGGIGPALRISVGLYDAVSDLGAKERLAYRIRSLNLALQKSAWEKAYQRYEERFGRQPAGLVSLESAFEEQWASNVAFVDNRGLSPEVSDLLDERFSFEWEAESGEFKAKGVEKGLEKVGIHVPKHNQ